MEAFNFCMDMEMESNDASSECFFQGQANWDTSDPFESALSSIVSSPTGAAPADGVIIRELIGKLGNICSSADNSCYATPLNSPPKLNLLSPMAADPAFAERAAKNSLFGTAHLERNCGSNPESREGSSVSDQIPAKKRKSSQSQTQRGKAKEAAAPKVEESNAKRTKKEEEPFKDYIHVRARRGQATDSHSLAERVRREKISERMKFLQDLVPGCNKVTGKAVMLDEIINYVQSLQRQVEFLSMKLATVNPRMEFNMEALLSKDMFPSALDPFGYHHQSQVLAMHHRAPLCAIDESSTQHQQGSRLYEDDLQSVVQMGFGQIQVQQQQSYNIIQGQMKVEQ